jgi:hypothetical protein
MAIFGRYDANSKIDRGNQLGTSFIVSRIRQGIKNGSIPLAGQIVATGADRLDTLAGTIYGDARYWWVLAAASDIGWCLQIPPGTLINIIDLRLVEEIST